MDQPSKEVRVRVEAPLPEPVLLPVSEGAGLPKFYYVLIFLTLALSGLSLYLSFRT